MDQLTRDCIAARKAGMTYGKWKSLQPHIEVEKPAQEDLVPKRVCRHCGKEFTVEKGRRYYCDYDCYYEAGKVRIMANYRKKRERMKANGNV